MEAEVHYGGGDFLDSSLYLLDSAFVHRRKQVVDPVVVQDLEAVQAAE